jgi:hypothetical protein
MPQSCSCLSRTLAALLLAAASASSPAATSARETDLDRFMAAVLAQRDENWKKLQQYVLDERETADVLGPGKARLFGLDREYTWFIKEGVFVRSPVRIDGVTLSDKDRRAAESEWIARHRGQDARPDAAPAATTSGSSSAGGGDLEQVLKLTREPQFVSAAYFLKFKFEPGRYAFVGREQYDGRTVVRVEYYPTRLYADDHEGRDEHGTQEPKGEDAKIERQMNKVALVTLWIEPDAHQIVQYRFDNVGLTFLPARSMVRLERFGATMRMGQPFPGVWLPRDIVAAGSFTLANGTYDASYAVSYHDYREADVAARVR